MRLIFLALLATACAPTLVVSKLPSQSEVVKVNGEIGGKDGTAIVSGAEVAVEEILVGHETTTWQEGRKTRRVPTAAIERIDIKSQAGGASWGAGIAAVPGILAGLVVAGTLKSSGEAGASPFLIGLGIAAGAAAIGALVGAAIGSRHTVEFCKATQVAIALRPPVAVFTNPDGRSALVHAIEDPLTLCVDRAPSGGFHKVFLPDGRSGFVVDSSLRALEEAPPPAE